MDISCGTIGPFGIRQSGRSTNGIKGLHRTDNALIRPKPLPMMYTYGHFSSL